MFVEPLMLQVNLPMVDTIHLIGNKFVTGVKINVTGDSKLKVYMTEFFLFARSNLPNVLISTAKKVFSIAIFLSRVLMYQTHQISLPVGYKTATPKTEDWE